MSLRHIIELERDGGIFYSGETIRGKVKLINDPSEDVRWFGASVILVEQQILCSLERLWFYPYVAFDAENRCYDFDLLIPAEFYSTVIAKYGKHSYHLKATFCYENDAGATKELIAYKDIIIVRPLSVELYDYIYNQPWQARYNSYIRFQLERKAYIPGQNLHFEIQILQKMNWKHIKVSIWQCTTTGISTYEPEDSKPEKNCHNAIIDSTTIRSKTFLKGQCFSGMLQLPKGIALSTNYPIFQHSSILYFRIVTVEYFVRISLCRKLMKTKHLSGEELVVSTKPYKNDEEEVQLDYEVEEPSNFCLQEDPKMIPYAYIPQPGIIIAGP